MKLVRSELRHRRESVGEVELHWVEQGEGPAVVLLHGFPEFWYSWRYQIPALAGAGLRAVAPDLRGYNASDRPPGVSMYRQEKLVADVVGLLDRLGLDRADLVGHDWGGVLAWQVAARAPERVRRLVVLNAPHPAAVPRELLKPRQILRSWYIFFFQLPWLPERLFRASDYERVERVFRRDIERREVLEETDFMAYVEAAAREGALTGMINWYRAAFRDLFRRRTSPAAGRVEQPTLLVWGEDDRYLGVGFTEGLEPWVPDLRVERLPGVSHWVHVEAWERVNRLLLWFLLAAADELG